MARAHLVLAAAAALAATPARPQGGAAADEFPGVDVSTLTAAQRAVLSKVVADEFCHCGCPHTLGGCLREHRGCKHAPRMVTLAARLAGQGLQQGEVLRALTDYYGAFDKAKRARLEVKDFGPPLGDPAAPVTIVEFSDFTCPYCQQLRPELERFVLENAKQVKLYYKPFPLPSHARSAEAAAAAEWARDRGLFWKMHDRLFDAPHALSDDDLAAHAEALGADAADLRAAVADGRNRARVAASTAEARAAGLRGTPTLFVNGRRLDLPVAPRDLPDLLRFAIEDELEWAKNGGWRDEAR
jgi:protein-disulfide isomerase